MQAVAQRAELVLLQAADEPRPFSIRLPVLSVLLARAGLHVPLWRPLAGARPPRTLHAGNVNGITFSLHTSELEPVSRTEDQTLSRTIILELNSDLLL